MGAEYKVHTKLLTEFETLGVMGENNSGIIKGDIHHEEVENSGTIFETTNRKESEEWSYL